MMHIILSLNVILTFVCSCLMTMNAMPMVVVVIFFSFGVRSSFQWRVLFFFSMLRKMTSFPDVSFGFFTIPLRLLTSSSSTAFATHSNALSRYIFLCIFNLSLFRWIFTFSIRWNCRAREPHKRASSIWFTTPMENSNFELESIW